MENASIARRVLSGEDLPQRAAVLLNAAATLLAAGVERDPKSAAARIARVLDEGEALRVLESFVAHGRDA
jgi:anthranilate phosphoribosyltransferase